MYYYKLKKKSIICIEGKDSTSFLQGIITNNTNKIKTNRVIYSTLLSPQGKLLHDFFLFTDMGKIYLDAPKHNINKRFLGRKMVRFQRIKLRIRPRGVQDTPDSAHLVPGPSGPREMVFGVKRKEFILLKRVL